MPEYEALSSSAEVKGNAILAIIEGMTNKDLARDILAKYGLSDVDPNSWYPEQSWLNIFSDISGELGDAALYLVGRATAGIIDIPSDISSIQEAIDRLDEIYQAHHKGRAGSYIVTEVGDDYARIESKNPRPCAYDMGFLSAFLEMHNDGKPVEIEHEDEMCCRKMHYFECVYIVKW